MSLHIKKAYCIETHTHVHTRTRTHARTHVIIQCQEICCAWSTRPCFVFFLRTMAATIRRVRTARGSAPRADVSRRGRRRWTVFCLSSFQTVLFPHRWDREWSKVWPLTVRSPCAQRGGATWAKGTFQWRACTRPWATGRKVRTLAWGAPRGRRGVWKAELGQSPPGTSADMEEDRITHTLDLLASESKSAAHYGTTFGKGKPTPGYLFLLIIWSSVCFMSRIREWFRCSSQRFLRRISQESRRTTAAGNTQHCGEKMGWVNNRLSVRVEHMGRVSTKTTSVAPLHARSMIHRAANLFLQTLPFLRGLHGSWARAKAALGAVVRWRTHRIVVTEHAFPVVVHYMVVFWKHCPLQEKEKV